MKSAPKKDYVTEKVTTALSTNCRALADACNLLTYCFEGDFNTPIDVEEVKQRLDKIGQEYQACQGAHFALVSRLRQLLNKRTHKS